MANRRAARMIAHAISGITRHAAKRHGKPQMASGARAPPTPDREGLAPSANLA